MKKTTRKKEMTGQDFDALSDAEQEMLREGTTALGRVRLFCTLARFSRTRAWSC